MNKRMEIPPDAFSEEEMVLINSAIHRTNERIMLNSKHKYSKDNPEGWFLANCISDAYYKKGTLPGILVEFYRLAGEGSEDRAKYLMDLGQRAMEALYGVNVPETQVDPKSPPKVLSYCEECGYYHSHRPWWSPGINEDTGKRYYWKVKIKCPTDGIPRPAPPEPVRIEFGSTEDAPVVVSQGTADAPIEPICFEASVPIQIDFPMGE